jgi:integrative and conjugative element protein (TIGR02256 family)
MPCVSAISSWSSADGRRLAILSEETVRTLDAHRQMLPHQPEAGGILLGRRRGQHFEIAHATIPFATDRQSRYGFLRAAEGHAEAAIQLWTSSRGMVDYLGEWHTHPEILPTPSAIDLYAWRRLMADKHRPNAMLTVIVGLEGLHVAILKGTGEFEKLLEAV